MCKLKGGPSSRASRVRDLDVNTCQRSRHSFRHARRSGRSILRSRVSFDGLRFETLLIAAASLLRLIRSVTVRFVITGLSRCCFVLIVALSIFAVTLPVRGARLVQPPAHPMSCCKHFPGEPGHCGGGEPVQSQDSQCCSACNGGLSLFLASASVLIFSSERGEKLFSETAVSSSRSDRPPVPPPRA